MSTHLQSQRDQHAKRLQHKVGEAYSELMELVLTGASTPIVAEEAVRRIFSLTSAAADLGRLGFMVDLGDDGSYIVTDVMPALKQLVYLGIDAESVSALYDVNIISIAQLCSLSKTELAELLDDHQAADVAGVLEMRGYQLRA